MLSIQERNSWGGAYGAFWGAWKAPLGAYQWTGEAAAWSQPQKMASLEYGFRLKVERVLARLRGQGFQPELVFGWRQPETQAALVAQGASTVDFSFHNNVDSAGRPASLAADLRDPRYPWEDNAFYRALGSAAKAEGLYWGGDWKSFKDWGHIEDHSFGGLGTITRTAKGILDAIGAAVSAPIEAIMAAVRPEDDLNKLLQQGGGASSIVPQARPKMGPLPLLLSGVGVLGVLVLVWFFAGRKARRVRRLRLTR